MQGMVSGTEEGAMSETDQYREYAREAMLAATAAKTAVEKSSLFDLAGTWTRAAMLMRAPSHQEDTVAV
jgi:hypothetical protein